MLPISPLTIAENLKDTIREVISSYARAQHIPIHEYVRVSTSPPVEETFPEIYFYWQTLMDGSYLGGKVVVDIRQGTSKPDLLRKIQRSFDASYHLVMTVNLSYVDQLFKKHNIYLRGDALEMALRDIRSYVTQKILEDTGETKLVSEAVYCFAEMACQELFRGKDTHNGNHIRS